MCKLLLTRPSQQYAQQVMSYKKEMEEHEIGRAHV